MPHDVTVTNVERVPNPDDPEYRAYVDVVFSTGVKVRHAALEGGGYLERVFQADDWDDPVDENVVEDEDAVVLEEFVTVWMDVTLDLLDVGGSNWDVDLIRGDN